MKDNQIKSIVREGYTKIAQSGCSCNWGCGGCC